MGYEFEFNWALKIKPEQGFPENLEEGKIYKFVKGGSRIYPLGSNIQLIDKDWNVFGEVQILEFTVNEEQTSGSFKLVKIYSDLEKKTATNLAKESAQNLKEKGYVSK